jgi:hypothetical protein
MQCPLCHLFVCEQLDRLCSNLVLACQHRLIHNLQCRSPAYCLWTLHCCNAGAAERHVAKADPSLAASKPLEGLQSLEHRAGIPLAASKAVEAEQPSDINGRSADQQQA